MERRVNRRPVATDGRSNASAASASAHTQTNRASQTYRSAQPGRSGQSVRSYSSTRPYSTNSTKQADSTTSSAQTKRASQSKRPAPHRRKRRDPVALILPILLGIVVLAGSIYVGSSWLTCILNSSTYCSNIFVNDIELSPYTREEGLQYMHDLLDSRLNATITLTWEGDTWSFTARDFGGSIEIDSIMERAWNIGHVGNIFDRSASIRALKENPIYLSTSLVYDEDLIDSYIQNIYDQLYIEPVNATLAADLNNPYVASESSTGRELDSDAARSQIVSLIEDGEGTTILPVLTIEPALSTEQALSSMDLIVDYQTDMTARRSNSRFNVRKALGYFYGMIVQPGEQVSFNEVVGPRNEERGWQSATEYLAGNTKEGYGGGICQASTTLYGALLKAGMTIIDRSPHSMTVAYVDPSIDAAVTDTGDGKDLVFRNDTENPITIYTEVTKEYARVRIYGVRPQYRYELESKIVQEDSSAVRVSFLRDENATYCYYDDEFKLYKEGRAACWSEGWIVSYDWDTGEEVERKQLSLDSYGSGTNIYWRGIHTRDGGIIGTDGTVIDPSAADSFSDAIFN